MRRPLLYLLGLLFAGVPLMLLIGPMMQKGKRPRIDAELLQRAERSPLPGDRTEVRVTWTGVAGIRLEVGRPGDEERPSKLTTVLVDPYVTRHGTLEFLRPIDTDEPTVYRAFPRADAILVSHAHHDSLGDVPSIATRTGATVYGTSTTCVLARAMGVPDEQCVVVQDGDRLSIGDVEVQVIAHEHGRAGFGIPIEGTVEEQRPGRPWLWQMKEGGALAFVLRADDRVVYHQATSGLTEGQLEAIHGLEPDLALVGVSLRQRTPQFEDRLLGALRPVKVAPISHDDPFGARLSKGVPLLPGVDIPSFEAAVERLVGKDSMVRLDAFSPWSVPLRPLATSD